MSNWRDRHLQAEISEKQQALQEKIAATSRDLENLNRRVEVTRLLFDHFFDKTAKEQRAVIGYLRAQFPDDLKKKGIQQILVVEAEPGVASDVAQNVASVRNVTKSKVDEAVNQERNGFLSLINANLTEARTAFLAAYAAFPSYHNVQEISQQVLTEQTVAKYSEAGRETQRAILKGVLEEILTTYSWGIPSDLQPQLKDELETLRR